MPLTIYNPVGVQIWSTDTIAGGVIADVKSYASNETATLNYPSFAGRTVYIINVLPWPWPSPPNINVDYNQGWPRVTVGTAIGSRKFAVIVL